MAMSCASYAQDATTPAIAPVVEPAPQPAQINADFAPAPVVVPPPEVVPVYPMVPAPPRSFISCDSFTAFEATLKALPAEPGNKARLDSGLLGEALDSYRKHNCTDKTYGPSSMVVVDFALNSNEPRLWLVDLMTGQGMNEPVLVTHGIGSDPDDNGVIDFFGNIKDSLTSSVGAVRGAEVYYGKNGRSLRLDGLDPTNSELRRRDIVVHSVNARKRTYFRASYVAERNGVVGTSEGCFVVVPELRDWLIDSLSNGGFLFAGASGERGMKMVASMKLAYPVVVPPPPAPPVVADASVPQTAELPAAAPAAPVAPAAPPVTVQ